VGPVVDNNDVMNASSPPPRSVRVLSLAGKAVGVLCGPVPLGREDLHAYVGGPPPFSRHGLFEHAVFRGAPSRHVAPLKDSVNY